MTLISSNIQPPSKVSNLSNTHSLKKNLGTPLIDYVYPKGIPLKKIQANLHFSANIFHTNKIKDPQHSYDFIPTLRNNPLPLQDTINKTSCSPLISEVVPCQEDSKI